MYKSTNKKFIYYCYNKKYYKVPTFGRIFKVIDFGRSIYKYCGNIFCSDSFQNGGDAATQTGVSGSAAAAQSAAGCESSCPALLTFLPANNAIELRGLSHGASDVSREAASGCSGTRTGRLSRRAPSLSLGSRFQNRLM
jgi:hypothetical protein